jgi:hypothetical protein
MRRGGGGRFRMQQKEKSEKKKKWAPMQIKSLGKATDLIQGGGGKLSLAGGDPGEGKKQASG